MSSLKKLVESQGVTVCAVIHQPRLNIFNLFDSLILLGVGGRVVYHGDPKFCTPYFTNLGYTLPPGESVADWLIDISSGRLPKDDGGASDKSDAVNVGTKGASGNRFDNEFEEAKMRREVLYDAWKKYFQGLSSDEMDRYSAPQPFALPATSTPPGFKDQLIYQIKRSLLVGKRNIFIKLADTAMIVGAILLVSFLEGIISVTKYQVPNVNFDNLVSQNPADLIREFPAMFAYTTTTLIQNYGHKIGVLTGVLVALTAAKNLTDKRLVRCLAFFVDCVSNLTSHCPIFP